MSSPAVLGVLLEGFDAGAHPRDFRGRWRKGDKVHVVTPQGHVDRRGSERSTTVQVRWEDGDVTHERPGDIQAGHPARSLPTSRRATLGKAEGDAAARTRAEILAKSPGAAADLARYQSIASGARDRAFDPVTMLGREGTAARERGASSSASEHADTRDKLTNLPVGQTYGLHGPRGQVGRVDRTAKGFEVYGPHAAEPQVHKSPSSAAGHAMRIQRSAAQSPRHADVAQRNYSHHQQVAAMNARQSQRAEAEAERQLEIRARTASSSRERALAQTELDRRRAARTPRPRIRESAPEVLGALLEGC